jgi:hypothetical protein
MKTTALPKLRDNSPSSSGDIPEDIMVITKTKHMLKKFLLMLYTEGTTHKTDQEIHFFFKYH